MWRRGLPLALASVACLVPGGAADSSNDNPHLILVDIGASHLVMGAACTRLPPSPLLPLKGGCKSCARQLFL